MAMDHGLEEVIFESDNLQLINSVCNGASSCPWEIRSLVEYVLLWASSRPWSCKGVDERTAEWHSVVH